MLVVRILSGRFTENVGLLMLFPNNSVESHPNNHIRQCNPGVSSKSAYILKTAVVHRFRVPRSGLSPVQHQIPGTFPSDGCWGGERAF